MPMVSIIVPIHNAEKYLNRCIDSILEQEWKDFELILADDGSEDASGEICDGYAAQDTRVRVIHKANSGVSDTRNQAISIAEGTFLQFIDSDDWITPDATRRMVEAAESSQADLVIGNFYRVSGNRVAKKGAIEEEGLLGREEFAENMMENPADFYYGVLWNKLYRRSIVKKHGLRMNENISWCEDFLFNLEYCCYVKNCYILQTPIYYYVKRKGSLASQGMNMPKVIRMKMGAFEYYDQLYKNVWSEEEYERRRHELYRFFVDSAGDGFVPPVALSSAQFLGSERVTLHRQTAAEEGIISELYCTRKLFERELSSVAMRFNITMTDALLLLYLKQERHVQNRKELADILGISKSVLSHSLQALQSLELIKAKKQKDLDTAFHELALWPLPKAAPVLEELGKVQEEFNRARLAGLTEEEKSLYFDLAGKIKNSIRETLK